MVKGKLCQDHGAERHCKLLMIPKIANDEKNVWQYLISVLIFLMTTSGNEHYCVDKYKAI